MAKPIVMYIPIHFNWYRRNCLSSLCVVFIPIDHLVYIYAKVSIKLIAYFVMHCVKKTYIVNTISISCHIEPDHNPKKQNHLYLLGKYEHV
jgi:hypothetical protein